jgi:uncharacterized protein with beta-barrel porin domain
LALRGTLGWHLRGSLPFTVAGLPVAEDALVLKAGRCRHQSGGHFVAYSAQFAPDAQDQRAKSVLNVKS